LQAYRAPLRDIDFVLKELLDSDRHDASLAGCEAPEPELLDALLRGAATFAEEVVARCSDRETRRAAAARMARSPRRRASPRRPTATARAAGRRSRFPSPTAARAGAGTLLALADEDVAR
jgi:hypothetical protein